jgi:hypothetical protein
MKFFPGILTFLQLVRAKTWLLSLYPKYDDQELQHVRAWLEKRDIKIEDVLSEYQLRVILVDANEEQIRAIEHDEDMMNLIETIEEEEIEL